MSDEIIEVTPTLVTDKPSAIAEVDPTLDGKTKQVAAMVAEEMINLQDQSGYGSDDEVIAAFLQTFESDRTKESYQKAIARFREALQVPFKEIDLATYSRWYYEIKEMKEDLDYSDSWFNGEIAPIRSLIRWAYGTTYLRNNVAQSRPMIPVSEPMNPDKLLSEKQVKNYLEALNSERKKNYWLIVRTLYESGGRITEIVSLQCQDLSFNEEHGFWMLRFHRNTKRNTDRHVGISDLIAEEIHEHIEGREPSDPLFTRLYRGEWGAYTRQGVGKILKRMAERHNLPDCSPHKFRHSIASHAARNGRSSDEIAKLLGHADPKTAHKYYIHQNVSKFTSGLL